MINLTSTGKSHTSTADSISSESTRSSTIGSIHLNLKRNLPLRFVWRSTWEYMITALAFTTGPWCMWSFVEIIDRGPNDPNIYQFFFVYIFVGLPLVYMLVILGQYAQMGLLHLKYMCPIGHGNAYICLILILFYLSLNTIDMADFLMYFLTTLQEKVQWMLCPSDIADQCWSGTDDNCQKDCISDNISLSAYWYWNKTYMDTVDISMNMGIEMVMPSLPRMISISFSVALVWFILVFMSISFQRKIVLWLFYVSFIFAIGLMFSIGGLDGSGRGLAYMYGIDNLNALYNFPAWSRAVAVVLKNLCLGRACQMVFGSYMPSMNYSGIRTLLHVLTNMIFHLLFNMLTYMAIGAITSKAKVTFVDYRYALHHPVYSNLDLIVMPQCLGLKYAPQFWNLLYFGMNFCMLLSNQILLQEVFVKCVSDSFENLLRYSRYIYSALCLFMVLMSILLITKGVFLFYNQLRPMLLYVELIVMVSMSIVILWIYGIKRLSDDLHFITGQQPTKFWKIFWIINPVILLTSLMTVNLYTESHRHTLVIMQLIFYFICTSPIPILGCFEMFKYLKKRNLVGMFQPAEIWGPPDPDERIMRHVFNPRKEIKSRRRTETCQHKCLLGSKVLKRVIQEEAKVRNERILAENSKFISEEV